MGRAKFLSIPLLGFLFPNAGFPRVESEQRPEQSKRRGGVMPPRRVVFKSARERSRRRIYPTALIPLRHRFLVHIRPIF